MQELHLCSFSLAIFIPSIFSLHFSFNLSTNLFLYLQFLKSRCSPTSHNLSHSKSQLLGFQINPLLDTPLSIF